MITNLIYFFSKKNLTVHRLNDAENAITNIIASILEFMKFFPFSFDITFLPNSVLLLSEAMKFSPSFLCAIVENFRDATMSFVGMIVCPRYLCKRRTFVDYFLDGNDGFIV